MRNVGTSPTRLIVVELQDDDGRGLGWLGGFLWWHDFLPEYFSCGQLCWTFDVPIYIRTYYKLMGWQTKGSLSMSCCHPQLSCDRHIQCWRIPDEADGMRHARVGREFLPAAFLYLTTEQLSILFFGILNHHRTFLGAFYLFPPLFCCGVPGFPWKGKKTPFAHHDIIITLVSVIFTLPFLLLHHLL